MKKILKRARMKFQKIKYRILININLKNKKP